VPELGLLGSVRGALSNERPYRECNAWGSLNSARCSDLVVAHVQVAL
jgi:hypothetical protein